jgi:hypothetical protein
MNTDESECWNCQQVADELCVPAVPLDLISLYRKPSKLREWLTCYKGRLDGSEPLIPEYIDIVKALLTKFFYLHGDRIAARAAVDCIVVVPSTDRPPPHPLHTIFEEIGLDVPVRGLMRRGNGDIGRVRPARDGFVSTESSAQRVLLADDVYASGAHVNSAAAALRTAGHTIAGSFVIARRINPDYREEADALWQNQVAQPFTWRDSPIVNKRS